MSAPPSTTSPSSSSSSPSLSSPSSSAPSSWRSDVLVQLRNRNRRECEPFTDLIKAFERTASLQQENTHLLYQNERLQQMCAEGGGGGGHLEGTSSSKAEVAELNRKLYTLQEELTALHRRKGDNAQQVIDLVSQVKSGEAVLADKLSRLAASESRVKVLSEELDRLRMSADELEQTNQLLKDEYTTLQLALTSAERKLVEAQKENDRLLAQVMELKDRDVTRMNQENDLFAQRQQELMRQQLAEAAMEPKVVVVNSAVRPERGSIDSVICYSVRLPNRAYLKFEAHDSDVNAIKWSPHGLLVATGGADRKIKLWDISKGTHADCRGVLTGSNGAVMSIDFDSGGTFLLGSSLDFACRLWSLDDLRLRHTLTGHSAKIMAAKFMGGENTRVCSGSHDRTIRVWDLRSRACINTLFPGSSCNDLVCLDQMIVSGHFDKKLRLYDVRTGTQPTSEITLEGKVTSVDLASNGQHILACTRDDSLSLIDLRSAGSASTFRTDGFHVGCDWTRAVFSPDSEYVSVGSMDGTAFIWNVRSPDRVERTLKEHDEAIVAVAWQPAGNSMTTCDKAKQVVVWADI